jgi:TPR repeat protein
MYAQGEGVKQDDVLAASWYRKAADQGELKAQHNLGIMYSFGQGVPQDPADERHHEQGENKHPLLDRKCNQRIQEIGVRSNSMQV